jgi:hypothetical protein
MHIITIGCAPVALQFVFKNKESAEAAWNTAAWNDDYFNITDDFGQSGTFRCADISCRVIEDCDLSKRAHIERSLHQQRTQFEFQKAAESDVAIRAGMRGPAVLSPVPGMFNGRGN